MGWLICLSMLVWLFLICSSVSVIWGCLMKFLFFRLLVMSFLVVLMFRLLMWMLLSSGKLMMFVLEMCVFSVRFGFW